MPNAEQLLKNVIFAMKEGRNGSEELDAPLNKLMLEQSGFSKDDFISMAYHVVFDLYGGNYPDVGTTYFTGPAMLMFSHRLQIEELYLKWIKENGVADKPNSLIAYMEVNGWLNEERILTDLKIADVFKKKEE